MPLTLLRYYPEHAPVASGRPWWTETRGPVQRSDGLQLLRSNDGRGWLLPLPTADSPPMHTTSIDYATASWDRHKPIPFPGRRTGQVWARVRPDGVVFTYQLLSGDQRAAIPACFHIATDGGMVVWGEDHLRTVLHGAFLLADPCAPRLAPWAPAEGA